MRIGGFQKLTLVDYPGKIAATVFTVGCSFRCPFCHNPELVLRAQFPAPNKMEQEFFKHLEKRKGKLEGVCITGGEPTIQPDIIPFIKKIKEMGFLVKLDSNGTRPDILRQVFKEKLVDFVAMDIKNTPEKYSETTGVETKNFASLLDRVKLSVDLIRNSGIPYEFRTTVVPGIHSEEDFLEIGKWLEGSMSYFLQEYRDGILLDPNLRKKTNGKKIDLKKIKKSLLPFFQKVGIRYNN